MRFLPTHDVQNLIELQKYLGQMTESEKEDLTISIINKSDYRSLRLLEQLTKPVNFRTEEKRRKLISVLGYQTSVQDRPQLMSKYLKTISDSELEMMANQDVNLLRAAFKLPSLDEEQFESSSTGKLKLGSLSSTKTLSKFKEFSEEEFEKFLSRFEIDNHVLQNIFEKIFPLHLRIFLALSDSDKFLPTTFEVNPVNFTYLLKKLDFEGLKFIQDRRLRVVIHHDLCLYPLMSEVWRNVTIEDIEKLLDFKFNFHLKSYEVKKSYPDLYLKSSEDDERNEFKHRVNEYQKNTLDVIWSLVSQNQGQISKGEIMNLCLKYNYSPSEVFKFWNNKEFHSRINYKKVDKEIKMAEEYLIQAGSIDEYDIFETIKNISIIETLPLGKKNFFEIYIELWSDFTEEDEERYEIIKIFRSRYPEYVEKGKLGVVGSELEDLFENFCKTIRRSRYEGMGGRLGQLLLDELEFLISEKLYQPSNKLLFHLMNIERGVCSVVVKFIHKHSLLDDSLIIYILDRYESDLLLDLELERSINKLKDETLVRILVCCSFEKISRVFNSHLFMTDSFLNLVVKRFRWSEVMKLKIPKDKYFFYVRSIRQSLMRGEMVYPKFDALSLQPDLLLICPESNQVQALLSSCRVEIQLENHPIPECQKLIDQHNSKFK